jgi:hypothetical protein
MLGVFSPSVEGLWLAFEQFLRLTASAGVVAALLACLDVPAWMNGLHVLLQPLARVGGGVDRFILRLRMVLDHLANESLSWRAILLEPPVEQDLSPVCWDVQALSFRDGLLMGLVCLLAGGVLCFA